MAKPIACDMTALSPNQHERYDELRALLDSQLQEVSEHPAGYGFRFSPGRQTWIQLAEFVELERLCCPFLIFALTLPTDDESIWMALTGPRGTKAFLREEFGLANRH